MFGQSLLSGAFGTALVPGDHFMPHRYTGATSNPVVVGGKYGGSAAFNGSDNYWVTNPGLGESGDRTRAVWVYINNMPAASNGDAVYYLGNQSANEYYENLAVRETAGSTTYKFRYHERYDTSSNESFDSITTLTTGVWYHVALVFDGSTRKLYINGSLDTSATFTNKVNNTSYPLYAGTFRNTCCYLDGVLDQFRLYNTALNATQIGYLYNASNTESTTLDFPSGTGCKAAYTFNNNGNTILSQDDLDTVDFPSGAGCVGLYRLQNSGVDTAGNNNGTLVNAPGLQDPLGPFGDCMDFTPASSQYINLGTGVYNGYTAMTVSAWVWYDAASNYPYTFWAGDGGTDGAGIGLALNHSTWKMYSWNGGTTQTSTAVFNAYQWYHVAVTYGGTTCKLYINGDLDSTHTVTAMNLDTSSNPTSIGYYSDSGNPGYYFDGKMAQMRIYNTALTAAQIETLAKGEPKYNGTVWPSGVDVRFNRSLNFKPDLIFAKSRGYGYPPMVADSVRGFGSDKMLFSDFTGEQGSTDNNYANAQAYGYLSNINDNGFYGASGSTNGSYIGTGSATNNSGYISWNWKAGADTYAGLFNGSTSKFKIASPLGIGASNENDNFSISMWVTWDSVDATAGSLPGTLVGDITGSNYGSFHIYVYGLGTGNGLSLGFERYFNGTAHYNSAYNTVGTISSLVAQKWYNVTHTYVGSSKEVKLYLDGTLITTYTLDTTSSGRTTNMYNVFGDYNNSGANGHDGQIDQIRMFNTTLSSSQINSLVSEGLSNNNTLDFPTGAGCTAAYTFDDTANSVVNEADLSTVNFPSGTTGAALYQFNDSVNGTAGPNPTTSTDLTFAPGVFGKSLNFNGSSSVWQSTNQIIEAQQDFTISFWVKLDAYNGNAQYLWTSYATGDCGISLTQVDPYDRYFSFHKYNNTQSPASISINAPDIAALGQWYHLCATFSTSTGMAFYIDGNLVGTDTTTWVPQDHGAYSDSIGCYGYTPSGNRANFTGQIDQFRAYQEVLTANQVRELVRGYYPGTPTAVSYVKSGYTGKNNDGTIESQVSVNQDAGFSIVKWSGYNTAGATVGHGLGKQPQLIITKNLTTAASWPVFYGSAITTSATTFTIPASTNYWLGLNDTWAYTAYTLDQQFGGQTNGSSNDQMISYCWVSVPKYSKIGNYTGGSSGKQVNVGFQPSWLLIKRTDSTGGWRLQDSKRVGSSVDSKNVLELNGPWAEQANYVDLPFTATGFTLNTTNGDYNSSGGEYIYMAFA